MSMNTASGTDQEECQLAVEAAMDVALEHCIDDEQMTSAMSGLLGVEPDVDCEAVVNEGLDRETCGDSRAVRQWVMCRSFGIIKSQDVTFSDAMELAWDEAKDECSNTDL